MKKSVWRWCLLILIVSIGAAGYWFYHNLPTLVEAKIQEALHDQGVTGFTLGEPYWGLEGAGSSFVSFKGQRDNWQFSVEMNRVGVQYSWRALTKGKVKQLSVEGVTFDVTRVKESNAETKPLSKAELRSFINELSLPVDLVMVAELNGVASFNGRSIVVSGKHIALDNSARALSGALEARLSKESKSALSVAFVLTPSAEIPWIPTLDVSVLNGEDSVFTAELDVDQNLDIKLSGLVSHPNLSPLIVEWLPREKSSQDVIATKATFSSDIRFPEVLDFASSDWWRGFDMSVMLDTHWSANQIQELGLTNIKASGAVNVEKSGDQLRVTAPKPLDVVANLEKEHWPQLENIGISDEVVAGHLEIVIKKDIRLELPQRLFEFTFDGLNTRDIRLQLDIPQHLRIDAHVPSLSFDDGLVAAFEAQLNGKYQGISLPETLLEGTIKSVGTDPTGLLSLVSKIAIKSIDLTADIDGSLVQGRTKITGRFYINNMIPLLVEAKKFGIDISSVALASGVGELIVDASKEGATGDWLLSLNVAAEHISGLINGVALSDASVRAQLVNKDYWQSSEPIIVKVPVLSPGVTIENLSVEADLLKSSNLDNIHWRLNSLSGEVFSGTFGLASPAKMEFPFSGNTMEIQLSNLDLAKVFQLYAEQGVNGTGKISGSIPLYFDPGGVSIAKGRLYNLEAGKIQFAASGSTRWSNEQLAMTMRLLENFRYEVLKASAEFSPSGQLVLQANISGNNPAEFDGRQVNFNINVEENLFDLYKALSLTDKLTRELEEKIQGKTGK